MNFLVEYGLFLAKAITFVLAVIVIVSFLVGAASKNKSSKDRLKIKKLNERYEDYKAALNKEALNKTELKQLAKENKQKAKAEKKTQTAASRVFVLNFNGDIRAQATQSLREEITAILLIATPCDEVVVRLESAGGLVSNYGLAASQLKRLRDRNIPLTIIVDRIAASGGYMMACVGDKICAAECAIIGSIGVVAQIPNFHRLLKRNDIDFEQITAGEYKRTLSLFGENTEKGREKVQEDVDNVQEIFKSFIIKHRPQVNIDEVATGEHWHGIQALKLKLVDELMTSDDYLMQASRDKTIFEVHYEQKKSFASKISHSIKQMLESSLNYL